MTLSPDSAVADRATASHRAVGLGLIGCGTVGGALVSLLDQHADAFARRFGLRFDLRTIVRRQPAGPAGFTGTVTRDVSAVLDDPAVDIVIELMGGIAARRPVELALARGKHVVTANKLLLAAHGPALHDAARSAGVALRYEAAVCGGLPILALLTDAFPGDRLVQLSGIINGSTNFILTELVRTGRPALGIIAAAQRNGYLEADPSLDLDGHDAAQKLVLLLRHGFGADVLPSNLPTHGIGRVDQIDLDQASQLGASLKLVAHAQPTADGLAAHVWPTFLPPDSPLAAVSAADNAVLFSTENTGAQLVQGRGAGGSATANAVLADLVAVARLGSLAAYAPPPEPPEPVRLTDPPRPMWLRADHADQLPLGCDGAPHSLPNGQLAARHPGLTLHVALRFLQCYPTANAILLAL